MKEVKLFVGHRGTRIMNEFIQIDRRYFIFFAFHSMMSRILKRLVFELDYLKKEKNINDEIDGERGEEFLKG